MSHQRSNVRLFCPLNLRVLERKFLRKKLLYYRKLMQNYFKKTSIWLTKLDLSKKISILHPFCPLFEQDHENNFLKKSQHW